MKIPKFDSESERMVDISLERADLLPTNQYSGSAAYGDMGGMNSGDERTQYMFDATSVINDSRKVDIGRALGELGLIRMTPDDFGRMTAPDKGVYSHMLSDHILLLHSRSRVLATDGSYDHPTFEGIYNSNSDIRINQEWAHDYARELGRLEKKILSSSIGGQAQQIAHRTRAPLAPRERMNLFVVLDSKDVFRVRSKPVGKKLTSVAA